MSNSSTNNENYVAPFHSLSNYQLESIFLSTKDRVKQYLLENKFQKHLEKINNNGVTNKLTCNYYNEDQFVDTFRKENRKNISVFHINISSLSKHHLMLLAYLKCLKHNFDVIFLSEIGHQNADQFAYILDDYNFDFVPSPTNKGGVGIFFKKNFIDFEIKKQQINDKLICQCPKCQVEDIWLEVSIDTQTYIFCACYRHPSGNVKHFSDALEEVIEKLNEKAICFFGGDINIDLLKADSCPLYDSYLKLMMCNCFTPTITLPTRITDNTVTLIDHIFIKVPHRMLSQCITAGNLFCDISDHLPNFCFLEVNSKNTQKDRPLIRLYSSTNFTKFQNALNSLNMTHVMSHTEVDAAYNSFIELLSSTHNECFPLVKLSRKKVKDKPWLTPA